ncbi:MAG: UTP--glucose-1-phosphate uridylyltransferase, partial [Rhodanobacteraceae bacterium]|nr:UTP--glucose-1-phosphate uridylyltransferase [Rhodanobacteraceae bacterium]
MNPALRKVVFPVAGLGTRFLPATKVVAKEMLPVLDRPLIQYAVDEAVDAGADTLVFVTNRYKHAIADYFDKAYELESKLAQSGKAELLAMVQGTLPRHVRCVFVTQPEALGLGHAVLCAKPVVGDEPFGVVLPDDLIWNGTGAGALRQMAQLSARENGAGVIAVEEVAREQTDKYGIVDATPLSERAAKIKLVVEKPTP